MSLGNCQLSNCNACNTKKNRFWKLLSVICYLLFVTQKIRFWKLSTVNCNAWGWCH